MQMLSFSIATIAITLLVSPSQAGSWRCQFPNLSEPLTFIETGDRIGKMVGNNGVSDLWIIKGQEVVSFIEPVASGAVMTTTIFTPTGEAVHSRNTVMALPDDDGRPFVASQVMGNCVPAD